MIILHSVVRFHSFRFLFFLVFYSHLLNESNAFYFIIMTILILTIVNRELSSKCSSTFNFMIPTLPFVKPKQCSFSKTFFLLFLFFLSLSLSLSRRHQQQITKMSVPSLLSLVLYYFYFWRSAAPPVLFRQSLKTAPSTAQRSTTTKVRCRCTTSTAISIFPSVGSTTTTTVLHLLSWKAWSWKMSPLLRHHFFWILSLPRHSSTSGM